MAISRTLNELLFTDNSESDNTSYKKPIFIILTILIGIALIQYLNARENKVRKVRDKDGFDWEDKIKQEKIWNTFALSKLLGFVNLDNQTELFFKAIGREKTNAFLSSTNQIIQFGISTGDFALKTAKEKHRKLIGYDYSPIALRILSEEKEVETRLVNLNAVTHHKKLFYQDKIEKDLQDVSDVLLIRILEYLNPEAVKLLIISLINNAKPGSRFYVETLSPLSNLTDPSGNITISYCLKPGTISTFFKGRNDLNIEVLDNTKNPHDQGNETLERLLIKKI